MIPIMQPLSRALSGHPNRVIGPDSDDGSPDKTVILEVQHA